MATRDEAVVRQDAVMWSIVAQIFACHARVEAMTAENMIRQHRDEAMSYSEVPFCEQAELLETLAGALQTRV